MAHDPHQDPRRRVYIKSQPWSASPDLAVGAQLALSTHAGAQLRRTRRPMGRVEYGALGGRGMYIRIASSATSNSDDTGQCIFSEDTAESYIVHIRWLLDRRYVDIVWMLSSTVSNSL